MEHFNGANKPSKEHTGSILAQCPASTRACPQPVTLSLDLHQMPPHMPHFMQKKESHQGPHLGLLNVLNLEHVLKL